MQSDQNQSYLPNFDNLNTYLSRQINCEIYLFIIDDKVLTPIEYTYLLQQTFPITVISNSQVRLEYKYLVLYNKMVVNNVFKIRDMPNIDDPFENYNQQWISN